jgi:hypothetical protein
MRFVPHPRAFSASIADTSSGVRISILRESRSREELFNTAPVMGRPADKGGSSMQTTWSR